jgi:beta-lactamase superfamily II metal-dependent hydrolase
MTRLICTAAFACCVLLSTLASCKTERPLEIFFIDVEGGQATLIVSPSGQSMLVDTGWPGFNGRDADRIVAVAHEAGLKKIDYVLITHYHRDHVGGATQLADRIGIGKFLDHGTNQEDSDAAREEFVAYEKLLTRQKHQVIKAGDRIPLNGVDVQVLTAAGVTAHLPGANQPNPLCATEPAAAEDSSENARSIGTLFTFGNFRFVDLGDLTKKKELELACPNNLIGNVDVFLTSHHGLDQSNARALVHALHPRVAIMNNGAHKGGKPEAWKTVHESPGLLDFWQLHYAMDAGKDYNAAEDFIANPDEKCEGKYIKVSARRDGSFTVLNSRNQFSKTYMRRDAGLSK